MHLLCKILNKSVTVFILSQNGCVLWFGGDPSIYFYQIYLVIYHKGCHLGEISVVKKANLS